MAHLLLVALWACAPSTKSRNGSDTTDAPIMTRKVLGMFASPCLEAILEENTLTEVAIRAIDQDKTSVSHAPSSCSRAIADKAGSAVKKSGARGARRTVRRVSSRGGARSRGSTWWTACCPNAPLLLLLNLESRSVEKAHDPCGLRLAAGLSYLAQP